MIDRDDLELLLDPDGFGQYADLANGKKLLGVLSREPYFASVGTVGIETQDVYFLCRSADVSALALEHGDLVTIDAQSWEVRIMADENGLTRLRLQRP